MSYLKRDKENILEHKSNQGIYSDYNSIGTTQTWTKAVLYNNSNGFAYIAGSKFCSDQDQKC